MPEPMLEISRLNAHYRDFQALYDVDMTLDDIWATDLTKTIKPGKENVITPPRSEVFFRVPSKEYGFTLQVKSMRDLQEAPQIGDTELPGTEEHPRMLFANLYFGMVSKAVAMRCRRPRLRQVGP